MTSTDKTHSDPGQPSFTSRWFSFRRKRFWVMVLIAVYTLAGFFAVPALVDKLVVSTIREDLGREASFAKVAFNPYVLSLRANGFRMDDKDGVHLASFDEFFVNFQLSSLFQWALIFREIRLDGFYLNFERFALDDTRLSRLMADAAASRPPAEPDPPDAGGLPRLLIQDLGINRGRMSVLDHVPESPVQLEIGPVDVSISELNTLPDRYGQQAVVIKLPGDATLGWQGNISLAPLESEGELTIENSHLDKAIAYLKAVLPLESVAATLSARTHYRINTMEDGDLHIELDGLELGLADVAVSGLTPSAELLKLSSLALIGGRLRYPENELSFSSARLTAPEVNTWLNESGKLNLLELAPDPDNTESVDPAPDPEAVPWKLGIDEFVLDQGQVSFSDHSISPAGGIDLTGLQMTVRDLANEPGRSMPFSLAGTLDAGGDFGFEGDLTMLPALALTGRADLRAIPLRLAQPYVQQKLNLLIESGALTSQSDLTLDSENMLNIAGTLGIAGLKIQDTNRDQELAGWEQLDIDRFELDVPAKSVHLSRVQFQQPYGRIEIAADRTTNLNGLAIPGDQPPADSPEPNSRAWSLVVGGIGITDGSMDFSDLSLPLPFGTHISDLDGTVSTIDAGSSEPANVRLEGQVDEYGLARIDGSMSVFDPVGHTDLTLEFRNLALSNLSPYTVQFAGQQIDEGKLNLDLRYFIDQGQLQGQNKVVLSDLVLGARVDHPDAASLPLGLAVALLKDSNGVIDIDLPVEGDVNDPEFRIGGVVMKAFAGLITKLVSAPFRLLGNLIGIDSEDLGQFQFLAGRSDLTPPELEKITQLQQALQQRPDLKIEIRGPFDPEIDVAKMQYFRLRDTVIGRLGKEVTGQDEEIEMLDEEIRTILETLYTEKFPDSALSALKEAHTAPPADNPEGKSTLDALAYAGELRDRLLAAELITTADLERLANTRAASIQTAFLASGEFGADRVRIADPVESASGDGEWVVTELGVAVE